MPNKVLAVSTLVAWCMLGSVSQSQTQQIPSPIPVPPATTVIPQEQILFALVDEDGNLVRGLGAIDLLQKSVIESERSD